MARLRVEVVYALAGRQEVVSLQLPDGASAGQAAEASGLGDAGLRLGIGGKEVLPSRALREGDRVEFLRPLALDPGEARRRRAKRKR
jgi:putative ubiquitin-RnfH superfamily antitoxin RatB of RatAB toxin-antitoxin module